VTDKGSAGNPAKDAAGAKGTGCIDPNNRPLDSHPSQKIQAAINQLAAELIPYGIKASAYRVVRVADNVPPPKRDELGDLNKNYWRDDRDPWQFVRILPLFDQETHESFV
jgi:hypothetical protein